MRYTEVVVPQEPAREQGKLGKLGIWEDGPGGEGSEFMSLPCGGSGTAAGVNMCPVFAGRKLKPKHQSLNCLTAAASEKRDRL